MKPRSSNFERPIEILGINHIGLAAKDAKQARWFLSQALGLQLLGEELVPEQKTNTVMYESSNLAPESNARLEILEPTLDETGPIAKFLAKKGGGIHHLAVSVKDLDAAIEHLVNLGVEMIDAEARRGAHNTRVAFVHPHATGGLLVELVEEQNI